MFAMLHMLELLSVSGSIAMLVKRVRPECLAAVAFPFTRVHECDIDVLAKFLGTRDRGIVFGISDEVRIHSYILDHIMVLSLKHRTVRKSGMEAEVVG